jgi:ketosteroid isomerase-like protein
MQHPNIDIVQGLYAAYMAGDRDHVTAALAPDIRWHNSGFDALAGTIEGVPAVLDYLMGQDHMEDYRLEVIDILASDTRVAIVARSMGHVGSHSLTNDYVQVIRLESGRVAEVWNYNWDQRAVAEAFPADPAMAPAG